MDNIVDEAICHQLSKLKAADSEAIIRQAHKSRLGLKRAQLANLKKQLTDKQKELADYQAEVLRVIRGEISLSRDTLTGLIDASEQEADRLA